MSLDMGPEWVSMKQACDVLGVSLSTLRRRISRGEIESKLDKHRRLVLIRHDTSSDTSMTQNATLLESQVVEQLKRQTEMLQEQLDKRETEVAKLQDELSQSKERSDTIILQLTRQVDQSQRLLEYNQEPWYRKWFKKKREEKPN